MRRSFTLAIEPFSLNAMYCRDIRYKSAKFRNWQPRFFMQMAQVLPQQAFKDLREAFDPLKNSYLVCLTYYYPEFFTKKDAQISAQTEDLSNCEKIIVDALFLPKNHAIGVPYGCPNLNIDDKHIVCLTSKKKPAKAGETKTTMRIDIAIVAKPVHP